MSKALAVSIFALARLLNHAHLLAMLKNFIRENRAAIGSLCREKMRVQSPDRDAAELFQPIDAMIDQVEKALEQGRDILRPVDDKPESELKPATQQGKHRLEHRFEISQLAYDYGAVCDSISSLAAERGFEVKPEEWRLVNIAIDEGIAASLAIFHRAEQEHSQRNASQQIGFQAHEMRNALSSGMLAFEALRTGRVGISGRTADVVGRSFTRLNYLIEQMLAEVRLGRAEAFGLEQVNVRDLILAAKALAADSSSSSISIELEGDPSWELDAQLAITAISNVIQNGVKYSPEKATVMVRAYQKNAVLIVEVHDACGGLPDGKVDELFEAFRQHDAKSRGLGLGLAIVQRSMDKHKGQVSVENIPDEKCIFKLEFPSA